MGHPTLEVLAARAERVMVDALEAGLPATTPTALRTALHHAVFPAGARIRPRLALAAAVACGDAAPALADAAAAAVELLHCASLVHDDLPCFDDAAVRRGRPTVCRAFGEPLAVLAGDALIVLAFETAARAGLAAPDRLPAVLRALCRGAGAADGIVAGQALELDPAAPREQYHRLKTGALFVAAVTAGSLAGGGDPRDWEPLGHAIGAAYQIADDLGDALSDAAHLGKPAGQDVALGRPSAVRDLGVPGALEALSGRLAMALAAVPPGPLQPLLRRLVTDPVLRFLPPDLAARFSMV